MYRELNHWFPTSETDRNAALAYAARHRRRLVDEYLRSASSPVPTFGEFAAGFYDEGSEWVRLQNSIKRRFSSEYLPQMRGRLRLYLMPALSARRMDTITGAEFLKIIADLKPSRKTANGELSNSAKSKVLDCGKNIFAFAKLKALIRDDPLADIHHLPSDEVRRDIFTAEELARLFPLDRAEAERVWQTQMWLAYGLTLRYSGARPSEVHALTWEDWDSEAEAFPIINSVENTTGKINDRTKTGSAKAAFLPDRAVQELLLWKHFCSDASGRALIFSFDGEIPLKTSTARRHFIGACRRAGVELNGRVPYCLRHTLATEMLEVMSLEMVQDILGHSAGSSVTKASYWHPSKRRLTRSPRARELKRAVDEMRGE
jgi:integrase